MAFRAQKVNLAGKITLVSLKSSSMGFNPEFLNPGVNPQILTVPSNVVETACGSGGYGNVEDSSPE